MALTESTRGRRWSRLHFLVRLAGLSGVLAAGVGLVLMSVGERDAGLVTLAAGAAFALLAILVEVTQGVKLVAGRRSAFGSNVALQVALALLLLAGVNLFSFHHYVRADWTRGRLFTLAPELREKLGRLRGQTTIVVYQRHKTFGQLTDKPDAYDYAAERKVVEKVKDAVDEFRELGPQFKVVVLDVEEEGFNAKLDGVVDELAPQFAARAREESSDARAQDADKLRDAKAKAIRAALDAVPENSVFFFGNGKYQRLSFNEFYQLDKAASQSADDGRGNLVLLEQGIAPFARKVLSIDAKRPRIAVAVVHEVLGMEGSEELGMAGVKKVLASHGFEGRDVILKKWGEMAPPEPAVLTFEENKYERVDAQLQSAAADVKDYETDIKQLRDVIKLWQTASLDELTKKYADQLRGQRLREQDRAVNLANFRRGLAFSELMLAQAKEDRDAAAREKAGLNVESLAEQRRMADLKAKTDRVLADCDLLIVPRMTVFNAARREYIPGRVYKLDDAQVAGIKDFLKAGKPVLFCFGPSVNEPPSRMDPSSAGPDKLEDAVAELGIKMPRQTVLYNVESKSFVQNRGGLLILGANVEVPPVEFDWPKGAGLPLGLGRQDEQVRPNPIRESIRLAAHSAGNEEALTLRLRAPRPVYYEGPKGAPAAFQPEIMMTSPACWNDERPIMAQPTDRPPRYEPPKPDDPRRGTIEEPRRGPFPIGVAVEAPLPVTWYSEKGTTPPTVRVAAIGHGGVFMGTTLSPVREKLFLDTCNWLLGRDDMLTRDEQRWQFPRVDLPERQQSLWQWGARLGLPVFFAYLGVVVLMVRRLR